MIKESQKNKLPSDIYSRNFFFSILINALYGKDKKVSLLDVGGAGTKLSWFLNENIEITVLDLNERALQGRTNHMQGDFLNMDLQENSFDIVLSSVYLENLSEKDREVCYRKMIKISKRHVFFATPFDSVFVRKAEEIIENRFENKYGKKPQFFFQRRKNGLPKCEALEKILQEESTNWLKLGEGNIYNWLLSKLVEIESENDYSKDFNRFFNENLTMLGNFRFPCYRSVFVIDKISPLNKTSFLALVEENNNFHSSSYFEMMSKAFREKKKSIAPLYSNDTEKIKLLEKVREELFDQIRSLRSENKLLLQNAERLMNDFSLLNKEFELETERSRVLGENASVLKNKLRLKNKTIFTQQNLIEELRREAETLKAEKQYLTDLIIRKESELETQKELANSRRSQIDSIENSLMEYRRCFKAVTDSRAWKMIVLFRKIREKFIYRPFDLLNRAFFVLRKMGLRELCNRCVKRIFPNTNEPLFDEDAYQSMVKSEEMFKTKQKKKSVQMRALKWKPLFSVILPVYNCDEKHLRRAIESVMAQDYQKWELCVIDDASSLHDLKDIIKHYASLDNRIKVLFKNKNEKHVKACNDGLKMASGAYITFLDHDDSLHENSLFEAVKTLQEKKYDLVYTDEDRLNAKGNRFDPHFKSDYNADLLLNYNYISRLTLFRRKVVEEVGYFRGGTDGAHEYDLLLRFTDKPRLIKHIPKVLYHRGFAGIQAKEKIIHFKPQYEEAHKKVLRDAIKRRGIEGEVLEGIWKGSFRVKRQISGNPLVSIIIPFKDKISVLKTALRSIFEKTVYQNYEILLINNQSELLETRDYLKEVVNCPRVRVLDFHYSFNYSAINNFASKHAKGDYLLLLNNDTEVLSGEWIESMLEHAQRPEVGAVGAKLLYPNGIVQHAGLIVGIEGIAKYAFAGESGYENGYFGYLNSIRNFSAVSGACLMTRKEVYKKMGGMNENDLSFSYNDIDYCLRLREKGYLTVYTPYAVLYHHESVSKGFLKDVEQDNFVLRRHQSLFQKGDPFYNKNLNKLKADFSLEKAPPISRRDE